MYDTILFPTDGGPGAAIALDHALELATEHGATLHAVYVLDHERYIGFAAEAEVVAALEVEGEEVVRYVEALAGEVGVCAVGEVVEGHPAEAIVQYVTDHDVDLVVMATQGRRGLERYLLGSVTERVLRTTDVPILVVNTHGMREVPAGV